MEPTMTESLSTLFGKASQLDEVDRAALAGLLIESLDPSAEASADESVHAAWAAEIDRRVRDVDQGRVKTVAWEALRDRLDARGQARDRG